MSIFSLTITSEQKEFKILKSEIEKKLSDRKKYVVNFYLYENKPDDNILKDEKNIIIDSEYEIVSDILIEIKNKYKNFRFGNYDFETINYSHWMVVSLGNSQ